MSADLLERCIWSALNHDHAHLRRTCGQAMRYMYDYEPFMAARAYNSETLSDLVALMEPGEEASLVERELVDPPQGYDARNKEILQLVATDIRDKACAFTIEPLCEQHAGAMYELAHMTKPGPFRSRTHQLGRFIGIFDDGRLVAMGGERMAFGGYTEISAVCTHPDYRGRGLGGALLSAAGRRLIDEGRSVFLHSYADNEAALALYHSMGFQVRGSFWHMQWKKAA